MATTYLVAKRRANDCSESRSDSNDSGGRLSFGWGHFFVPLADFHVGESMKLPSLKVTWGAGPGRSSGFALAGEEIQK